MKPSEVPTWATDVGATNDPGSTRKATGFITGKKAPAKWFNWLHNRAGQWFSYLNGLHNEPEFLNKNYGWTGTHQVANEIGYSTPPTRTVLVPLTLAQLSHAGPTPSWTVRFSPLDGIVMQGDGTNAAVALLSIDGLLPHGGDIKRVRASIESNGTLYLQVVTQDKVAENVGSQLNAYSGSTADNILNSGVLSVPIDRLSKSYSLLLVSATTFGVDTMFRWIEITYTDPKATGH